MQRVLTLTKDGSHTIAIPEISVTYHSHHGAIQESQHVFIDAGFRYQQEASQEDSIRIFEMGFGTGLNALLTLIAAAESSRVVQYTTIEQFPLENDKTAALNYCEQLQREDMKEVFVKMHGGEWGIELPLTPGFSIRKIKADLLSWIPDQRFNIVYYDAFAPTAQPLLWTTEIFSKIFEMIEPGGAMVTYCSKSEVRRAMKAAGFTVTKIPGPRGKREMVRAFRR
ncbi:MAG: SAM-dependent methyltransferase [Chitinophagaceae bacterium]|nr:MAG: SAM-dependent methyltransferase [Chitinophagaceae bacterium]